MLALDAALPGAAAALFEDERLLGERRLAAEPGAANGLAGAVASLLAECGCEAAALEAIAVTVGPGSFTGLRGAIALALGLGAGAGVPVVGVSTGQAIARSLGGLGGRALWVATWARRGRVYLEIDGALGGYSIEALPTPRGPVAVAGDAAIPVASRLAARGANVLLTECRRVELASVAAVARAGQGREALPLYVDAPEAKLPAGGLRPAPLEKRLVACDKNP